MKNSVLTCITDGFFYAGGPPAEATLVLSQADLILHEEGISHEWFWHFPVQATVQQIRLTQEETKVQQLLSEAVQSGQNVAVVIAPFPHPAAVKKVNSFFGRLNMPFRQIPGLPVAQQLIWELQAHVPETDFILIQTEDDFLKNHTAACDSAGYVLYIDKCPDDFVALARKNAEQPSRHLLGVLWNSFWNTLSLLPAEEFFEKVREYEQAPDIFCWLLSIPEQHTSHLKNGTAPLKLIITRKLDQGKELYRRLRELGIRSLPFPTIETRISSPKNDNWLRQIDRFSWLVFSSANGVQAFFHHLDSGGKDIRALGRSRIAAVGHATAAALQRFGIRVDLVPEKFIADSLAEAILSRTQPGDSILVVRPKEGRDTLSRILSAAHRNVQEFVAYETLPFDQQPACLRNRLATGDFDMVLFSSPSTVRGFLRLFSNLELERLRNRPALCIGPVTEKAAREAGFGKTLVPEESSTDGIVQFLRKIFQKQ
jgi:uroporphyrinogen-III synthase